MNSYDYQLLNEQLKSITDGVDFDITNLANAAALLYQTLSDINWAGFYLVKADQLLLGPFQGRIACVKIPFGKGVCGTAAKEDRTVLVGDVHKFQGHIACDSASQSEIVIPIHVDGRLYGVLDIDSPLLNRFDETDQRGLEEFAGILGNRESR